MKRIFNLIQFVVSILYCGTIYGQNEFVTLTSSDFIKGLDNKDYIRERLIENGFTIVGESGIRIAKTGFYEYWQFKSMLYVDIIYSPGKENTIKVGINEAFTGLPERLIQSFPHNKNKNKEERLANINVTPINKKTSYSLVYSRDNDKVGVVIWFDYPYYFFVYTNKK